MGKNKRLYKVVIQEKESYTAYIFADDKTEAKRKAIFEDIISRSNQDFEQSVRHINRVYKKDFHTGKFINE